MAKRNIITGLDIGTTKISCLVAEITQEGSFSNLSGSGLSGLAEGIGGPGLKIIGQSLAPVSGVKKGQVVNIDLTVDSIKAATQEARAMAGVDLGSVITGIAGGHIKSFNSTGVVAVKGKEITDFDMRRVIDAAKAVAIPTDREILHVIPQEYLIDGQGGIKNPIGMSGVRLEGRVHVVTGAVSSTQNIVKCINKAGFSIAEICLESIASSEAVLSADEKDLGVVLMDIGGGTTDVVVFKEGSIIFTGVYPIGGAHITNDIAVGLRISQGEAERIKVGVGCALSSLVKDGSPIEISGVSGRPPKLVTKEKLSAIIEPRVEEILSLVHRDVLKLGVDRFLSAGVVVTGGGSLLEGITEAVELLFGLPAKRGVPEGLDGGDLGVRSPRFATAVGLLKYGSRHHLKALQVGHDRSLVARVRTSMKNWAKDLF